MSDQTSEMELQLRKLMDIAAGEPTRPITWPVVYRRARRRTIAAVAAAVSILLIGGAGAALAARSAGRPAVSPAGWPSGVPRYYFVQSFTGSSQLTNVIRATATGAVTASVHCPSPSGHRRITSVAAVGSHTFFLLCQSFAKPGVVSDSRIFGFRITGSGRISGYFPVRGGALGALSADDLAATPDGSRIAVLVPAGSIAPSAPAEIVVVNARTGAHAVWLWQKKVPGTIYFGLGQESFTGNGKVLSILGPARCIRGKNAPKCKSTVGEEVRAFDISGPGGQIGQGRVLLRQSAIMSTALDYINDAVISLDGSTLTLTEVGSGESSNSNFVEVLRVSAKNSKNRRVIFKMNTGNGFSYNCFTADPSRRFFILDAGPNSGTKNGWIDRGRLVPLQPTPGDNVSTEAW